MIFDIEKYKQDILAEVKSKKYYGEGFRFLVNAYSNQQKVGDLQKINFKFSELHTALTEILNIPTVTMVRIEIRNGKKRVLDSQENISNSQSQFAGFGSLADVQNEFSKMWKEKEQQNELEALRKYKIEAEQQIKELNEQNEKLKKQSGWIKTLGNVAEISKSFGFTHIGSGIEAALGFVSNDDDDEDEESKIKHLTESNSDIDEDTTIGSNKSLINSKREGLQSDIFSYIKGLNQADFNQLFMILATLQGKSELIKHLYKIVSVMELMDESKNDLLYRYSIVIKDQKPKAETIKTAKENNNDSEANINNQ